MGTWKEDIIKALNMLGGEASWSDIFNAIKKIRPPEKLTKTWENTVRTEVFHYSSDSDSYLNGEDLFYSVEGIRKGIWGLRKFDSDKIIVDLTEDDISFPEGKLILKKHITRERNPSLVREAKNQFLKNNNDRLFCEVCSFDFYDKYGEIGNKFIEVHHIIPVSELDENSVTKISDLIMVCSNCHRMLHRKRPWLTKDKLSKLIEETVHNNK